MQKHQSNTHAPARVSKPTRAAAARAIDGGGLEHGVEGQAPIQRKLSINKKKIDKHDDKIKVFSGAFLDKTLTKISLDARKPLLLADVQQKIDDMAGDHSTHVFKDTPVGNQEEALTLFMQNNVGAPLPRTFKQVNALRQQMAPVGEHYSLYGTVREDRPSGLATVDELGLVRNKEGEASLKGFATQIVDTPTLNYDDTELTKVGTDQNRIDEVKKADDASIERGIEDRMPTTHPSDSMHAAIGFGLGGDVKGSPKKLRTKIRWAPADHNEGTHMIADPLGPDHPLGSVPGSDDKPWNTARKRMEALANTPLTLKSDREAYVSGHLLNEQLGGPGNDERNLAPISSEANSLHKEKVENRVKNAINKRLLWMYYEVHTQRSPLDPTQQKNNQKDWGDGKYTSSFKCDWGQLDENGQRINKESVTLTFTDPTKLAQKKHLSNTNFKEDAPLKLSQGTGAEAPQDFHRVVLNTVLKTKSYLIAAQTLLPEYEKVSDLYNKQSNEWQILQSIMGAYDPEADVLDNIMDLDEHYEALSQATQSSAAMDTIYRSEIDKIYEYSKLKEIFIKQVKPGIAEYKKAVNQKINQAIINANANPDLLHALGYVQKLIEQSRHPMEQVIQDLLGQFQEAHERELLQRYRAEQHHSSKLEDKHHYLKQDFDDLQDDLHDMEDQVDVLKRQKQSRNTKIDDLESERQDLFRENRQLREELDKSDRAHLRKDKQIWAQQHQLDEQQRQMEAMQRKMEEMQRQLLMQSQASQQPQTGIGSGFNYPASFLSPQSHVAPNGWPSHTPPSHFSSSPVHGSSSGFPSLSPSFRPSQPRSSPSTFSYPPNPQPFLPKSSHHSPPVPKKQGSQQDRQKLKRSWDNEPESGKTVSINTNSPKKFQPLVLNADQARFLAEKISNAAKDLYQQNNIDELITLIKILLPQFHENPSTKNWALVSSLLEQLSFMLPDPINGWLNAWKKLLDGT